MELDELKTAWQTANHPAQAAYIYGAKAAKSESAVAKLKVGPIFEIVMAAIAAVWLGNFCYENFANPVYFTSGILLDILNVLLLATNIRKLVMVSSIDLTMPIIESQRRLTELRSLTILQTKWTLLASPFLWGLLMLVLPMGVHVDLIKLLGVPYMLGNVLFGIFFVPVGTWIVSKFSPKFKEKLADEISGGNMKKARAFLDDLRQFETG